MKKMLSVLIIFAMLISSSTFVFANNISEVRYVDSKDTIVCLDSGAYDIIMGISDIEKRTLLAELWCTPVYTEITYASDYVELRGGNADEVLGKYLTMTNKEIENAISELIEDKLDELSSNSDFYVTESFVRLAEKYHVEYPDVVISPPSIFEVDLTTEMDSSVSGYNVPFIATNKNLEGYVIASLTCYVEWTGDGTIIHSLKPKTTYTMERLVYGDGGLRKNREFIKTESNVDYGYVQKGLCLISQVLPGANPIGYLVIDVKVKANGTVPKGYTNYISPLAFDNYQWVNP